MNWVRANITDNPMMAEVGRFQSVIKGKTASAMGVRAILLFAILISGLIGYATLYGGGNTPPMVALFACLSYCCLTIPLRFYGAIAGERERRSWELLRVAPVTHLQITFGKFATAVALIFLIHAIFLPTYLLQAITYDNPMVYSMSAGYDRGDGFSPIRTIIGELFSLAISLFVAALTLFFSARSKRSFTALALTLGSLAVYLMVLPMLYATIVRDEFLMILFHPFVALFTLMSQRDVWAYGTNMVDYNGAIAFNFFLMCAFTLIFLVYAAKTLHFADNLVKFSPRRADPCLKSNTSTRITDRSSRCTTSASR